MAATQQRMSFLQLLAALGLQDESPGIALDVVEFLMLRDLVVCHRGTARIDRNLTSRDIEHATYTVARDMPADAVRWCVEHARSIAAAHWLLRFE